MIRPADSQARDALWDPNPRDIIDIFGRRRVCAAEGKCDMAEGKTAKTAERARNMSAAEVVPCPECGKPTRIVRRMKNRELGIAGGMYRSCSVCEFADKL